MYPIFRLFVTQNHLYTASWHEIAVDGLMLCICVMLCVFELNQLESAEHVSECVPVDIMQAFPNTFHTSCTRKKMCLKIGYGNIAPTFFFFLDMYFLMFTECLQMEFQRDWVTVTK